MKNKYLALYLHLVWATWDREPWITAQIERQVHRIISSQFIKAGCRILAVNGMPDHIHILVKYPATIAVSEMMKNVKGVSSRFINTNTRQGGDFRWQIGYGAFTVSRWDTEKIKQYIQNQKIHHQDKEFIDVLEPFIPKDSI